MQQKINNDLKWTVLKSFNACRRSFVQLWQYWPLESGDVHGDLSEPWDILKLFSTSCNCKNEAFLYCPFMCREAGKEVEGEMLAGILMMTCPVRIILPFLHLFWRPRFITIGHISGYCVCFYSDYIFFPSVLFSHINSTVFAVLRHLDWLSCNCEIIPLNLLESVCVCGSLKVLPGMLWSRHGLRSIESFPVSRNHSSKNSGCSAGNCVRACTCRSTHPGARECAFNKSFCLRVELFWVLDPLRYFQFVCLVQSNAATSFLPDGSAPQPFSLAHAGSATNPAWRGCCSLL